MHSNHLEISNMNNLRSILNSAFCFQDCILEADQMASGFKSFTGVTLPNAAIYKVGHVGIVKNYRTRRHILADRNRDFVISMPLRNFQSRVTQAGRQSTCEPGAYRLLSMSVPFSVHTSALDSRDCSLGLSARISGSMLRQLVPEIDDYPDLVLLIRPGVGKVLKLLLQAGLEEGEAFSSFHAKEFSETLINTIANVVLDAPEFELRQARLHRSSHARIFESAKDFIARNLSNPSLNCTLVADYCQVSKTYLHVVFAASSMKVSRYIRELRLQQCRANFLDPNLRHRTITEIMMNWGFVNPISFSQTYKTRFGKTPAAERQLHGLFKR